MQIGHLDKDGNVVVEEKNFDSLSYEEKSSWYSTICSKEEVDRIINMRNGKDYILRLRADAIIANMRLYRVALAHVHHVRENGGEWALESFFTAYGYVEFKNSLPKNLQEKIKEVSFGSVFTNEANGLIFETEYGICSVFSTALRYFVEFAELALIDYEDKDIPYSVRINAMRIAIRTMLGRETLDFALDPRGIIPNGLRKMIYAPYPFIQTFIAGHEYSHYINGDLKSGNTTLRCLYNAKFDDKNDYRKVYSYNTSQEQEFKADLGAMNYPQFSDEYYALYYYYTMLWFAMLAIYESVEDYIFPPMGYQKHPGARARYQNILDNARRPVDFEDNRNYYVEELPQIVNHWIEEMKEDVACGYEQYEMYGSVYLAAPNTEWRGRELIDRVDY